MDGFTVAGSLGFTACELDGGTPGQLTSYIDVIQGTPALYAAIGDPATGRVLDPAAAVLTVTGPDGTSYAVAANTATEFAAVAAGRLQALYLAQPQAGRWRIGCSATGQVSFRAMLATVPAATAGTDPLSVALMALAPRYTGDTSGSAAQVGFGLLRWGMWPLAVAVVTARATSGLALDLAAVLTAAFGIDAAAAASAVAAMAGQTAAGALLTIAREGGLTPPGQTLPVLVNGAADDGLDGWQLTANGGDGWVVQSGYSGAIGYGHNFAASFAWCRKQQVIDLVGQVGLTPAFLDIAPPITITDWVAAPAPDGEEQASAYQLTASLLNEAGTPVKTVTTGTVTLPPAGPQPQWQRYQITFDHYGPGTRSVVFADGGQDARQWDRGYGVKMTGGDVSVELAPPGYDPAELLANGSGQDGMTGWTNTSPSGNPWTVDQAAGLACPVSVGSTAFAVAAGTAAKQQVVDLMAAGLPADFLDTSPPLQAGQWVASAPGTACNYRFIAELLDASGAVIATLDSGSVQVASAQQRFSPLVQAISGYPAGLRSVRFSHSAAPAADGEGPACIAAATLQILEPPPPQQASQLQATAPAVTARQVVLAAVAASTAVPVSNPASAPYWWICSLRLNPVARGRHPSVGSGVLIPSAQDFRVLTVAHNMVERWPLTWFGSIDATPGSGSKSTASGMALQLPIEFMLHNQCAIAYNGLFDYGLVRMTASNWQAGGFVPTTEGDPAMQGQAATITGYPADVGFVPGTMYTENVTLGVYDGTQATITTSFTGGASGSAVYVRGTQNVVGVYSHGSVAGFGAAYMRRLDTQAAADVQRWSRAPQPGDRVCSMQLVIHTGDVKNAGTDDPISLTLGGQLIELDPLWMPMSGSSSEAKEYGHFDGYDLSPALRGAFPNGLFVSSLAGMAYELRRMADVTWFDGEWYVESLNFYVNGQRYHLHNTDRWLFFNRPPWDVISGSLP